MRQGRGRARRGGCARGDAAVELDALDAVERRTNGRACLYVCVWVWVGMETGWDGEAGDEGGALSDSQDGKAEGLRTVPLRSLGPAWVII